MGLQNNQVLYKDERGRVAPTLRPDWANDDKLVLSKEDVEKFEASGLEIPPHLGFKGNHFNANITIRGEGDIIYHFNDIKHRDFRTLLAEVVESHFGSTDDFAVDYVTELKSWALLAKGPRQKPLFNENHYTAGFLELVDAVLSEA